MGQEQRRKTALLLAGGELPHGDASANRAVALARALRASGWNVLLLSDHPPALGVGHGSLDGVSFANIGSTGMGPGRRLVDRFERGVRIAAAVSEMGFKVADIDLLIIHSTLYGYLLQRWADRESIPVVVDLMERHEPMQFKGGRRDLRYLRHRWMSRLAARRPAGLLLISSPLRRIVQPAVPTLVVPPFVDTRELPPAAEPQHRQPCRLSLAYAGTPNNKDLLGPLVDAIAALRPSDRKRVRLTIAGPSRDAVLRLGDVRGSALDACGDSVIFRGRLARAELQALWADTDFCVLLRPPSIYAIAGFPSKVPEAAAAGAALFGTALGDLKEYAEDGRNAVLVHSASVEEVSAALQFALDMRREELDTMRECARETAVTALSVGAWAPRLDSFLREIARR